MNDCHSDVSPVNSSDSEAGPCHLKAAEDYSVCQELGKLQCRLQISGLGIFLSTCKSLMFNKNRIGLNTDP